MKRTLRLSLAVTAFSASLLLMLLPLWDAANLHAQQGDVPTPTPAPEPGPVFDVQIRPTERSFPDSGYPNLDSDLNRIVENMRSGGLTAQAAAESAPATDGHSVAVTLHVIEGYAEAIEAYLEASGASPRNTGADYIEAYVPASLLAEASEQEGVVSIQKIVPPRPAQGTIVSGGVSAHGVPSWHTAGYKGSGVKIGIIDAGFMGFAGLQGSELPSTVSRRCYTSVGTFTSNLSDCIPTDVPVSARQHGTAVAEAVFDIAPEATYYIANPLSYGDLLSTTNWMVSQGVDVINMSLAWTFSGPGDGTSIYSSAPVKSVDAAVSGGIIWVNGAGNSARDSWYGAFSDSDSDTVHQFNSSGNECNGITVSLSPLEGVIAQLRWNDSWGGASKDLDLYMIPETSGTLSLADAVATSESSQAGESDDVPYERISIDHGEIANGEYCFVVRKSSGDAPSWVQLLIWGNSGSLQSYVSARSIANPAESRNSGMLAAGAARHSSTSRIQSFSSRGPTMDNRTKPDIVGADGGNSSTWGSWFGTSQASPHVAGLAALVKQRFSSYTPAQIALYLKTNALTRGTSPNNTWGHGFAKLPAIATPTPPSTDATLSALTLSDVSFGTFSSATESYTASVPYSVSETTVAPTLTDSSASYVIKLDGVTDADGTVPLSVGSNVISVVVTAEDTTTTITYTVTVTRAAASTDATLSALTLSDVDFGAFSSTTGSYTASVPNTVTRTTVTPTINDERASYVIKLGGEEDADGTVSLAVGDNVITIEVTAEDDTTTKTYTITVTRAAPLSMDATLSGLALSGIEIGTFASDTETYTASVANTVSQTTVTATLNDSDASYIIKLGGVADEDGTVSLAVGRNVITVEVTAEDTKTTKTYTVTVSRAAPPSSDATLNALSLSGISLTGFKSVTTSYAVSVAHAVSQTTVTPTLNDSDAGYIIKLGGVVDEDGVVSLSVGSNVITIEVTAEDGKTTQTYTVTITRAGPPSTDATLSGLTLSGITIGTFSSDTDTYTASVANSVTQTTVMPTVNDSGASYIIKLGGITDADGTVTLAVGSNVITVEVTAEDTVTEKTYTVTVTRAVPPSTDATLKALSLSGVNFGTFDSSTFSYSAQVTNSVSQTTVTPTVNDSGASYIIKLGGITDADGTVTLAVGSNVITVEVTAEDTTTTVTYTVTVTRAEPPSSDATLSGLTLSGVGLGTFSAATTTYTASVANGISQTTVSPTVNDSGASYIIKIGGVTDPDGTVALAVGTNVVTVVVTAEDTTTTRTYTVTVTRAAPTTPVEKSDDASLRSLGLSGVNFGTFDSSTTSYTARVANGVTRTTVTPTVNHPGASYDIRIGGGTYADGTVSLSVGSNVITVAVTAEDGQATRTYTVTVTRLAPPSTDATLSGLTLSNVQFGAFSAGTTSYTATVANSVTQTTVRPTVNHSGASYVIRLGGVIDADGTVSLAVGRNSITVRVTAQDSQTARTYTVTVTRAAPLSSDATLRSLTLSGVNFGTFDSSTRSYTAEVANGVTQTTVSPTVNDSGASYIIRIGGVTDTDGTVVLAVGRNVIAVVVTAEDGQTGRTYTVTVTRVPETDDPSTTDPPVTGELPNDDPKVNFRVSAYTHNWVELSWAVPNDRNITGYVVQRYEHDGTEFVSSGSGEDARFTGTGEGGGEHSLRNSGVEPGTLYQYLLSLNDESGVAIIESSATVRTLSSDATLSALALSDADPITLDPSTTDYTVDVPYEVSETTVTPTVSQSGAKFVVRLDGVEVPDGVLPLEVGGNVLTVEVTAEDGTSKRTYTVTVTRAEYALLILGDRPLDDPPVNFRITGFGEDYVTLAWEIPHNRGITRYALERYDHDGADFALSDWSASADAFGGDAVSETNAGLTADSLHRYDLALKADDETEILRKSFEVRTIAIGAEPLSADATLSSLSLSDLELDAAFESSTYHYTASVAADFDRTIVAATLSDSASSYEVRLGGTPDDDGMIELSAGRNVITVHVTAENGVTTGIYTVVVARAKAEDELPSDASLRSLWLRGIDYGAFDPEVSSYTAVVASDFVQTVVTPVRRNVEATHAIRLGEVEYLDGIVPISIGENVIEIEVTAEDGKTTQTYTVTVTRPTDPCIMLVEDDVTIEESWDDTCLSVKEAPGGEGDRYARFFTFTLDESAVIEITLNSTEDTYLYLLEGYGRDGDTLHENDDIAAGGVNMNSRLSVALQPGSYTIEATTYSPETSGEFTLAMEGFDEAGRSEPEPGYDACVVSVEADGETEGTWDDNCVSARAALSGTGDRYTRFYTFTLDEASDVTITLSSDEDTYLYLLSGHGPDGEVLHEADDIDYPSNTNSRLSEALQAGDYTIEATTYYAEKEGDFSLEIAGLAATQ